jgi:hypothetical protein
MMMMVAVVAVAVAVVAAVAVAVVVYTTRISCVIEVNVRILLGTLVSICSILYLAIFSL